MTTIGDTVIAMRQRDRLPIIAVAVIDEFDQAISLVNASADICFRMVDGSPLFPTGYPWQGTGWYIRPVLISNPPNGVVTYDWSQEEADNVGIGVIDLAVRVHFADGDLIYAPTDETARIVMRPEVFPRPGQEPHTYGADRYGTGIYGDPTPPPVPTP